MCTSTVATIKAENSGRVPQYTSLGSYTILYLHGNNADTLCAKCVAALEDHERVAFSTFDEGEPEQCAECGAEIASSYGPVSQ